MEVAKGLEFDFYSALERKLDSLLFLVISTPTFVCDLIMWCYFLVIVFSQTELCT